MLFNCREWRMARGERVTDQGEEQAHAAWCEKCTRLISARNTDEADPDTFSSGSMNFCAKLPSHFINLPFLEHFSHNFMQLHRPRIPFWIHTYLCIETTAISNTVRRNLTTHISCALISTLSKLAAGISMSNPICIV